VGPVIVYSTKEQDAFNAEADALAASLGWSGPAENELNEIRVEDAQNFLRKKFHEVHQFACHPSELASGATPEALAAELDADKKLHTSGICEHLAITDEDEVALVRAAIAVAYDRELSATPANPTTHAGKVGAMSANVTGSATAALGKLAESEAKARK